MVMQQIAPFQIFFPCLTAYYIYIYNKNIQFQLRPFIYYTTN